MIDVVSLLIFIRPYGMFPCHLQIEIKTALSIMHTSRSLTSNALESEINSMKLRTYPPKYLSLKKYKVTYSLLVNYLWIRARNCISSLVRQEIPHIRLHCKNWLVSFCLKHSYHFFLPDKWKKNYQSCVWKSRQTRIIKKANFLGEFV